MEQRPSSLAARLTSPGISLLLSVVFMAAVALGFWKAWAPPASFFAYNVPIAIPFALFFFDRLASRPAHARVRYGVDVAVLVLALLRVFAPPLPYASGHALFATYAALTAGRWPLRATAAIVLVSVAYTKVFITGGVGSLLAGMALAVGLAAGRRRSV